MHQIKSKSDWYKVNTLFNGPNVWTIEEAPYHMKPIVKYTTQNRVQSMAPFYHEYGDDMLRLIHEGKLDSNYRIMEEVPPQGVRSLIQGEFDGVFGRITYVNKPMRLALLDSQEHISRMELFGKVGQKHYNTLMEIVDMFPKHIIEFSIYDKKIGCYRDEMIIWEVRMY